MPLNKRRTSGSTSQGSPDHANDIDIYDEAEEIRDVSLMSPMSRYLKTGIVEPPLNKRKAESGTPENNSMGHAHLEGGLNCMRSTLWSPINVTRIESVKKDVPGLNRITSLLAG